MNGRGQNFNDFMKEQGLFKKALELAAKKIIAAQLKQEMDNQHLTKTAIAKNEYNTFGCTLYFVASS